jgi:hypothetical protein
MNKKFVYQVGNNKKVKKLEWSFDFPIPQDKRNFTSLKRVIAIKSPLQNKLATINIFGLYILGKEFYEVSKSENSPFMTNATGMRPHNSVSRKSGRKKKWERR